MQPLLAAGAIGFVSGIACRSLLLYEWAHVLFLILLSAILAGAYAHTRSRTYLFSAVLVLLFCVGSARVMVAPQEAPKELALRIGTEVSIEGTIVADPDERETSVRVVVRTDDEGGRVLAVLPRYPKVSYGDSVVIDGVLSRPKPFETEGGRAFDYPHFLAREKIFVLMNNAHVKIVGEDRGFVTVFGRGLYEGRRVFEKGISMALPEPVSALALGLVAGGKQGLGAVLLQAFTVAGLLPIVVLSGYNVMIVADAVLRGFRFMPRRIATLLAVCTIALFVIASGGGSSAVRAGIMAGVALFARATGRTYHALRILLVTVVLMLLANPLLLLFDPGFQFSVLATLGLVLGTPRVIPYLSWVSSSLLRETLATTIAAQVFVLPLLLYETGALSLVALPANLMVLPVVPLAMLLSFIAGVVGMLIPAFSGVLALPAYAVLSYIVWVAQSLASLPLAHLVVPSFPFALVVVMYLALFFLGSRILKNPSRS